MLGLSMTAAVGEVLEKAGFEMNSTLWGGVAKESVRRRAALRGAVRVVPKSGV